MRTELLITDLTEMGGNSVCIAGITHQRTTIRPILPAPGVLERNLFSGTQVIIRPRAVVTMELKPKKQPDPPHIEDHIWYQPETTQGLRIVDDSIWRSALESTLHDSVKSIFEIELEKNRCLEPGIGARSLGTVRARIIDFRVALDERNMPKFRLSFYDMADEGYFNLPITDLALRRMVLSLFGQNEWFADDVSEHVKKLIKKPIVYLRLGLTRPFSKSRHDPEKCYLQINGIYTFPDYLEGKCFADFRL